MATKNYSAGASGYLDPEGRNFETTVYLAGKPVLDKELNLAQDIEQDTELRTRRRTAPSGWLSDDFLNSSDMTSAFFTQSAVANELEIPQDLRAHVNGWLLRIGHTNANGTNLLDLGAGPAGAGTNRTDIVILEVWRRLLSSSPSTVGKSPAGRLWWYGNVKIDAADDVTLNFADDILDGAVGAETTKRVQIQYRLRVIQGVDIFANPFGLDDPLVVANSVPASAAAPDGVATVYTYANQSAAGDPGLWRAGNGDPSNTLGTVDGYIYAIPLCAVFRRNTTAFARNTNHNGGVASPGPSDRPDGLFHDIVDERDLLDLRQGISFTGWNYQEILEKNWNWILDNALRTETSATLVGGGYEGDTLLIADEIGVSNANGGDGVTTGDTPGANFIGEFDAVRRHFSDRSQIETVTVAYTPADGTGGGPNWGIGDEITIDPSALPVYGYTAFNWAAHAPSGVSIVDVVSATFIGTTGVQFTAPTILQDGASTSTVTGLGAVPQGSLTFRIDSVPGGVTNEGLLIELAVRYPTGVGLTRTPTETYANSISVNNPGQMPAGAPVYYNQILDESFQAAWRELFLTYETVDRTELFSGPSVGGNDIIRFRERVDSISLIEINAVPYAGSVTISDDGYSATLDPASFTSGDVAEVTFKAVRPFPQNDEQVTVYYAARAPQTVRDALLPASITLIPKYVPSHLYTMVTGSGSQSESYPFPYQYVQMPGVYPTSGGTFAGDHEFAGSGSVSLETFSATAGMLKLPTLISYSPNPEEATFSRLGGDVDAEGRSYYKSVSGSYYQPNAVAEPLKEPKLHRVVLPFLAELAVDSTLGKKGQLVLAALSSYWEETPNNLVAFSTNLATNVSSLSVYKIKGNLLASRSS